MDEQKPNMPSEDKKVTEERSQKELETPESADENIFSAVYIKQRSDNEIKKAQTAIQSQIKADAELQNSVQPTTVQNESGEKANGSSEKFKIIFILLIILISVIFLSSCLYLIFGGKEAEQTKAAPKPKSTVSASLSSPFDYQQIYNTDFPEGIQEKYKGLYAQNTDFVGWLTVPGTSIDTGVYKTDDNSYYLKHDNYGTYTKYGVPFMDYSNKVSALDRNTVIYGHNFDNKLIFDELHNYRDLDFYRENPVIEFNTLYKDYKWKVIAAFHTNGDSDGDNGYLFYYVATYMGNNSFTEFCDELSQRSYIHTGVDIQPDDKILTLSTCTYFFDTNGAVRNARFAVIARLVREGESEEVDVSKAELNDNVRYPQLYYTAYGGTNPYRNASKWVPESN